MLSNLWRLEARVHEIQGRLAGLEPAAPATPFAQVLAGVQQSTAPGCLPPAPVCPPEARPSIGQALPPPPGWTEESASATQPVVAAIAAAARRHGVDPTLAMAVARAESGLDPNAVSAAGALGLMQLMPDTARALGVRNPFDPQESAEAGVRYLAEQLQRFGDVPRALAAYNAGPARVEQEGGIPDIDETRRYIQRVLDYQRQYREHGLP